MDYADLMDRAAEAREKAYAPYSCFKVGAALLTADGIVYTGCNVENAAFSPGCCAERTAFVKAVSEGEREFEAIAIVGAPENCGSAVQPCPPCGVCRQVMMEFCDPQEFVILLGTGRDNYQTWLLKDLLPLGFGRGSI